VVWGIARGTAVSAGVAVAEPPTSDRPDLRQCEIVPEAVSISGAMIADAISRRSDSAKCETDEGDDFEGRCPQEAVQQPPRRPTRRQPREPHLRSAGERLTPPCRAA
jgi:hypothetical protein